MNLSKDDFLFLSDYLIDTPDLKEKTVVNLINRLSSDIRNILIKNPITEYNNFSLDIEDELSYKKAIISSLVLAEDDWLYEEKLSSLSREKKLEMYYSQLWRAIHNTISVKNYLDENSNKIWCKESWDIYKELTSLVFKTDDLEKISSNFSKEERKKYRSFIIKFIDNLEKLKVFKSEVKNKNDLIKELNLLKDFQIEENSNIDYEILPYWLVVYLEDDLFDNYIWSWDTRGLEINGEIIWLMCKESVNFSHLWGTVLFIKWDKTKTSTYDHETTHLIYDKFFRTLHDFDNEQLINIYWVENFYLSSEKTNELPFDEFLTKSLNALYTTALDMAKDEANAYYKEGRKLFLLSNYWYESFAQILDSIILDLKELEKVNWERYPEYRKQILNKKNQYIKDLWLYAYIITFFDNYEDFPHELCSDKDNLRLIYQFFINKWNKKLIQSLWVNYESFINNYKEFNLLNQSTINEFLNYWDSLDSFLKIPDSKEDLINALNIWSFYYDKEYFKLYIQVLNRTSDSEIIETLLMYIWEYFSIFSHSKSDLLDFQDLLYSLSDIYWDYKYYYIDIIDKMLVDEKSTLL